MKTGRIVSVIGSLVFGFVFGMYTPFPQSLLWSFLTGIAWGALGAWYDRG